MGTLKVGEGTCCGELPSCPILESARLGHIENRRGVSGWWCWCDWCRLDQASVSSDCLMALSPQQAPSGSCLSWLVLTLGGPPELQAPSLGFLASFLPVLGLLSDHCPPPPFFAWGTLLACKGLNLAAQGVAASTPTVAWAGACLGLSPLL